MSKTKKRYSDDRRKKLFYEKLQQSNILNETYEGDKIIEYPFTFIKNSTDDLKAKIEMFLIKYSTYYLEKSHDKLEINKSTLQVLGIGLLVMFFANMLAINAAFFMVSCFVSIPTMGYFYMERKTTSYLILSEKGFEFPKANLKLNWNVIKLIEVQKATRDTPGALIICFNDVQTFIKENPNLFLKINNVIDYDKEKLIKTGRFKVKCSETEIGDDALREEFQRYLDKYGQVTIQKEDTQKYNKEKEIKNDKQEEIKYNNREKIEDDTIINITEEKKELLIENKKTVDDIQNTALEHDLELQKLVKIQFKSQDNFIQMILLKEEEEYCLVARVEGLRLDGYCIFLKNQIKTLSYCPDFYNEILQKEYYFKLNTTQYINLKKWETIFNSYQLKNHFVEIKTLNGSYKGRPKEIREEKMVLNAFKIKDKGAFETVSIDFNSIILSSFETSELKLLEKYSY